MLKAQALEVLNHTDAHNGGTFWPWGVVAKVGTGYMVGGVVRPVELTWYGHTEAELARAIQDFASANRKCFRDPGTYLGTWVDEGKLYLDVSQHITDKATAIATGIARGELAIWDNAAGREIVLGPFRARLVND